MSDRIIKFVTLFFAGLTLRDPCGQTSVALLMRFRELSHKFELKDGAFGSGNNVLHKSSQKIYGVFKRGNDRSRYEISNVSLAFLTFYFHLASNFKSSTFHCLVQFFVVQMYSQNSIQK